MPSSGAGSNDSQATEPSILLPLLRSILPMSSSPLRRIFHSLTSLKAKRHWLLFVTAYVVACTRRRLETGRYAAADWFELLSAWGIHYLAVIFVCGLAYALVKSTERHFLARSLQMIKGCRLRRRSSIAASP